MELILGENIKFKQVIILVLTISITIGIILTVLYSHNVYYVFILIVTLFFFAGVNWLYSKVYEIRINNDFIACVNLYYKKSFTASEFDCIVASKKWVPPLILFPFPSPPYFILQTKTGHKYLFMDTSLKAFALMFNLKKYIKMLNEKVNKVIK